MRIDILAIIPSFFNDAFSHSILKRAIEKDIVEKIKSERPEIIDSIESSGKLEENTEKLLSQILEEHKKRDK